MRARERVGGGSIRFVTDGLDAACAARVPVDLVAAAPDGVGAVAQRVLDEFVARGATVAATPEGPYCAPLAPSVPFTPTSSPRS